MQNNFKTIRQKRGELQIKVAMALNTTQESISSYETGRIFPSPDMLIKLADYYNTSIDYLLCRTKYDLPINDIKPNNISDTDFMLLNKINKLSTINKAKAEAYIDGLNNNSLLQGYISLLYISFLFYLILHHHF